jgi:hypothetical protein
MLSSLLLRHPIRKYEQHPTAIVVVKVIVYCRYVNVVDFVDEAVWLELAFCFDESMMTLLFIILKLCDWIETATFV